MTTDPIHAFDVLVIGAGCAGLQAAIAAAEAGARTALVCKSLLGKASTVMADGGIAAAPDSDALPEAWHGHFRDTLRAGLFSGDWRMAQILALEAPQRIRELEGWGAVFDRTERGSIARHTGIGHDAARLVRADERSGMHVMRVLQQRVAQLGVDVFMECMITRLVEEDGVVRGAFGYRRQSGGALIFESPAVVLATGGGTRAWKVHASAAEHTADGIALALDAGAELIDMEFVQFHPTGLAWPAGARGMLVGDAARHAGGILKNAGGQRFMPGDRGPANERACDAGATRIVEPGAAERSAELGPGYRVSRAIEAEIAAGRGGPHGGVLLDLTGCGSERAWQRSLSAITRQLRQVVAVDPIREPIEVAPTCLYSLGGVRVDAQSCATTVPGLFAAGETAGGLHGADCLIGNALAEALVFGRRAGQHAADHAKTAARRRPEPARLQRCTDDLHAALNRRSGESPFTLHYELQECMHHNLGLSRSTAGLELARDKLRRLGVRLQRVAVGSCATYNPAWQLALELRGLLSYAQAVAVAASARSESRGNHARLEFPALDERFNGLNLIVKRASEGLSVTPAYRPAVPAALRSLFDDKEEGMPDVPQTRRTTDRTAA